MNKITVSDQSLVTNPTLESIEPGTIFCFVHDIMPNEWRIKTNKKGFTRLDNGSYFDHHSSSKVIPLIGSICIKPR